MNPDLYNDEELANLVNLLADEKYSKTFNQRLNKINDENYWKIFYHLSEEKRDGLLANIHLVIKNLAELDEYYELVVFDEVKGIIYLSKLMISKNQIEIITDYPIIDPEESIIVLMDENLDHSMFKKFVDSKIELVRLRRKSFESMI